MQLWREGQATDTTYRIHPMAMLTTPDPAIVSAVSLCRVIAIMKRLLKAPPPAAKSPQDPLAAQIRRKKARTRVNRLLRVTPWPAQGRPRRR